MSAPTTDRTPLCGGAHRPPVSAPITDPFRPPPEPWLPGNRGLEYGTDPGDPVAASQRGLVVFSGPIGAQQFITIDHGCDLVTTYSFLDARAVVRGDRVVEGQMIGRAGVERFHFGARWRGGYIDPELLFTHRLVRVVRLVR